MSTTLLVEPLFLSLDRFIGLKQISFLLNRSCCSSGKPKRKYAGVWYDIFFNRVINIAVIITVALSAYATLPLISFSLIERDVSYSLRRFNKIISEKFGKWWAVWWPCMT